MIPKNFWVKKAMPQQYTLQHTKINSLKNNFGENVAQFRAAALILHRFIDKNQNYVRYDYGPENNVVSN